MSNSAIVSRKVEVANFTVAPSPCSKFLMESGPFVYFCFFVRDVFCVYLFSLSSHCPWSVMFITGILVSLVTLPRKEPLFISWMIFFPLFSGIPLFQIQILLLPFFFFTVYLLPILLISALFVDLSVIFTVF